MKILAIETIKSDDNLVILDEYSYEDINKRPTTEIRLIGEEGYQVISNDEVTAFIPYHAVTIVHFDEGFKVTK